MSNKSVWTPTSSDDRRGSDVTGTQSDNKRALDVSDLPFAIKLDTSQANICYVGYASPSSLSSASSWRIMKVTSSPSACDVKWADGNLDFDNIWDDRASLTYE